MKFFNSKYYTPVTIAKLLGGGGGSAEEREQRLDKITLTSSNSSLASNTLDMFLMRMPVISDMRLVREEIINDWTLVTDLTSPKTTFTADIVDGDFTDLFDYVYFHEESELFVLLTSNKEREENYRRLVTAFLFMPFDIDAPAAWAKLIASGYLKPWELPRTPQVCMLIQKNGSFSLTYSKLGETDLNIDTMYPPEFKAVSDKLVAISQDKEKTGLIILHGEPGTGKTSYIKWLTGQAKRTMVFVPPELVSKLTEPTFLEFMIRNKGLTFIVEDAEHTLSARMGSEGSIVSTILNMTAGILGDILKCQFICTFNTELTNIDGALLRPGRLLVRHEFDKLSPTNANNYLESVGSEKRVVNSTSLAELTNMATMPVESAQKDKPTFGFNS